MRKRRSNLGCCGYSELAEEAKPKTTQPFRFGVKVSNIQKPDEPGITRRISSMGSSQGRYAVMNLGMTPHDISRGVDVFASQYMGKFGIVGVGDGSTDSDAIIEVLTTEDPETIAIYLPGQFMGFRLSVKKSGEILPQ